jgi:multiple sugar transport system permease protein
MKMNFARTNKLFIMFWFTVIAMIWAFICLFPLWWVVTILFSPPGAVSSIRISLFPTSLSSGFAIISRVFIEGNFLNSFVISVAYAGLQTLGATVVCSMAAYEFSFYKFRGKSFLFMLALSSMMIPLAVTIIPMFRILVMMKWLNTIQGLAVPGMASALALFIMRQFMEQIPVSLLESADIDGAGHFRKYSTIIMPLSVNACITAGVISFINAWSSYLWPLVVVQAMKMYPVSLLIGFYVSEGGHKTLDQILGALFLASILPVLVYIFFRRYIVQGFVSSGIKG